MGKFRLHIGRKFIQYTIMSCLLSSIINSQAQSTMDNSELTRQPKLKSNWIIECPLPMTLFELYETRTNHGLSFNFYTNLGYCFSNSYSIVSGITLMDYYDYDNSESDKSVEVSLRQYFFKKSRLFAGIGCQIGEYSRSSDTTMSKYGYIRPRLEIGYKYLITDLHPIVDNHLGIEIFVYSMIPAKNDNITEIMVFPAIKFNVGICYHF